MADRRPRSRRTRRGLLSGDRPYLLALLGLLGILGAMAVGPLQAFSAAADRVDALESSREALQEEVDVLSERRERLQDPEEIELLARADLGMVKPGEVPFVVVTPEPEFERAQPAGPQERGDDAWYRRLGRALTSWLE